jgi:GAF domain-containing protein
MPDVEALVSAISSIAGADTLEKLMAVVRTSARTLTQADGMSFVLREGRNCYYAEEDAVAPLWKGKRFPLEECISGWVMLNGQIAVIPDIYVDDRIPHAAYRPTFVKSLVMVPAPQERPLAAIGAYWSFTHTASWHEQYTLQAIANATGVALKNLPLYEELRQTASMLDVALKPA